MSLFAPRQKRLVIPGVTELPLSQPGMRIGLFGGSFNPPHEGHKLVSRQVLRRLNLDAVWWLVTPGNPLKDHTLLAPLSQRVAAARALIEHPRIHVTGFEAAHGFRFTYDSLKFLRATLPDRHFVWIMGTDSLVNFDQWEHWRDIAHLMPLAVYARPGSSRRAPASKAALYLARSRLDQFDAPCLATAKPPAWIYLTGLMSGASSTRLRKNQSAKNQQLNLEWASKDAHIPPQK